MKEQKSTYEAPESQVVVLAPKTSLLNGGSPEVKSASTKDIDYEDL